MLNLVPNEPDTVASEAKIYQAEGNLEHDWYLDAAIYAKTVEAGNYENIKIPMVGSCSVCHCRIDCAAASRRNYR